MLRISILFGLLAFASAVKKKLLTPTYTTLQLHCLHIFHCIKCHQRRISFQRRHFMMFLSSRFSSEKKDCRETLLHFHIHNSSVLCFIRAKRILLILYLHTFTFSRFQFPPSSKTGQIWRQHGVWTHLELLLPLSPERSLRRLLLDGDLLLIFWKYFIVSSAGWWFGFDFLKIFYCFSAWWWFAFDFFKNI